MHVQQSCEKWVSLPVAVEQCHHSPQKVFSCGSLCSPSGLVMWVEVPHHIHDIVIHGELHFAILGEIQLHPKVVMLFSPGDPHCTHLQRCICKCT